MQWKMALIVDRNCWDLLAFYCCGADCFKGLSARVKNYAAAIPLIKDLRSPAMRPRHWEALMAATKVSTSHLVIERAQMTVL